MIDKKHRALRRALTAAGSAVCCAFLIGAGTPAVAATGDPARATAVQDETPANPGDPALPSYPGLPPLPQTAAAVPTTALPCGQNGADETTSRSEALERAQSWLDVGIPYSQNRCYENKYGDYRTDCSGFVSMAWGVGGRGSDYWTGNLRDVSDEISRSSLKPGDALLRHTGDTSENHVALFVRWTDSAHTKPEVIEQTGSRDTVKDTWTESNAAKYTPVRYDHIVEDSVTSSISGDGPADLLVHETNGDVSARYNQGTWFDGGRPITEGWGNFLGHEGKGRLYFADINGDGRADLLVHDTAGTVSVRYNQGTWFDGGRPITEGWGNFLGHEGKGRLYFADINGDRKADLLVHDTAGTVSVRYNQGTWFDGGRPITEGWGNYLGHPGKGRLYFG